MKQTSMKGFSGWGGSRKGSGKKKLIRGALNHVKRPELSKNTCCHVTLKLASDSKLVDLQRKKIFSLFRLAVKKARQQGLRIVHYAMMKNHIHFIIEASQTADVSRGMQSFSLSFNKLINARLSIKVRRLWKDRYFMRPLRTFQEIKNALSYVLRNPVKAGQSLTRSIGFTSVLALKTIDATIDVLQDFEILRREILFSPQGYFLKRSVAELVV